MNSNSSLICMFVIATIFVCGCTSVPVNQSGAGGPAVPTKGNFSLRSDVFSQGGSIPGLYTCMGQNISPPLSWSGVPAGTKSLALVVVDTDSARTGYVHWVVYNISPNSTGVQANLPKVEVLPDGIRQGFNNAIEYGYTGPCPPRESLHHYHFQLSALDTVLDFQAPVSRSMLENTMQPHVLESTELIGVFSR